MASKYEEELSYATHKKHTVKFKIVFIGDQSVGKSSIINRFIKNQFDPNHNPTVGIDFVSKTIVFAERSIRLQLWDTAGQQRFKSLIPGYLRDSHAVFIIYDITNVQSYNNIMNWIDYTKQHRGDDVLIFIVGNKKDRQDERSVNYDQANQKFKDMGAFYNEVSAKTGQNLQQLFNQACCELLKSPVLQTTLTNFDFGKVKPPNKNITGERQRPIKKQTKLQKIQESINQNNNNKSRQKQMRGSKLIQIRKTNGKFVKQKNCC